MSLSVRSIASSFARPFLLVALLLVGLIVLHFGIVVRAQDRVESKETSWNTERPQIGRLALLKAAQEDLVRFKEVLPTESALPQLISFISGSAEARHLSVPSISYQPEKTEARGIGKVGISLNVKGDYREIRRLIYEIEQSNYFLIIENMTLASSGKEGERIQLQLRLGAYLRENETKGKAVEPVQTEGVVRRRQG